MKTTILKLAAEQKISAVGICSTSDYAKKSKGLLQKASFCTDKNDILTDKKSIIVCAFNYYNGAKKGNISRYAQGKDYHKVAIGKMQPICEFLQESGFSAQSFADTGALNERLLAELSGLAFRGKNQMAINDKLGSYFFIGYILTDCEIPCDKPNMGKCMECGRCIKYCPLGALSENGFCEDKCLSYITQKKGELSEEEADAVRKSGMVWGCDICQEVCPHNSGLQITNIDEFSENIITDLIIAPGMSNSEFRRIYGERAFSWRGKKVLERNQKVISGNI